MAETTTAPGNKTELLAFMHDQWNGFVAASDALPDKLWLRPVDATGWSVRDHVGHVVAWLRAEIPLLAEGTPIPVTTGMPESLWATGDTDAINEWYRNSIRTKTPSQVRTERDQHFPVLVAVVSGIPEDDFPRPARERGLEMSDRPLLQVMSENYGYHFDEHRNQIDQLGRAGAPV